VWIKERHYRINKNNKIEETRGGRKGAREGRWRKAFLVLGGPWPTHLSQLQRHTLLVVWQVEELSAGDR